MAKYLKCLLATQKRRFIIPEFRGGDYTIPLLA